MSNMIKSLSRLQGVDGQYDIVSLDESANAYIINCQAINRVNFNDPVDEGLYISFIGENHAYSLDYPDFPAKYFTHRCTVSVLPEREEHNPITLPKGGKIEAIRIHFPLQHNLTKNLIPSGKSSAFRAFELYDSGWQMSLTGELRKVALSLWDNPYQGVPRRLWVQGKVRELLALMMVHETPLSLADQACERIAQQPHVNWTIPLLTKELATNECYLKQAFKEKFNMGVASWVQSYRINLAKERLVYQHESITKIALDLGYQSSSYFAKVFKQKTGLTPKSYRQSLVILEQ